MSSIRSETVPTQYASTIMALFRVPLNLFVVTVLMNIESLGHQTVRRVEEAPLPHGHFCIYLANTVCLGACTVCDWL